MHDKGRKMPKSLDYMGSAEFSVLGVILWSSGKRALWDIDTVVDDDDLDWYYDF
jgi:hypothetical protein